MTAGAATVPASLWRPGPARLAKLVTGLLLFGAGDALIVAADLGATPWTVLAQGVAEHTPLAVGGATILISFVVLLAWIPIRQAPGLGTVLNAILIGIAIDATLLLLPDVEDGAVRLGLLVGGIGLVGLGSGLYLTSRLGPGPRDGLMTGLARRTGRSLRLWRTLIEGSALAAGVLLGGVAGFGTVLFVLTIGPAVQGAVELIQGADAPPL